jgi:hypothetical protein
MESSEGCFLVLLSDRQAKFLIDKKIIENPKEDFNEIIKEPITKSFYDL